MKNDNHIIASVSTVILMALLFLLLWFVYIGLPENVEEEGIEVVLGEPEEIEPEEEEPAAMAASQGSAAPAAAAEETTVNPAPTPVTTPAKPVIAQEDPSAVAARKAAEEEKRKQDELAKAEAARKKAEEAAAAAKKAEEDAKKAKAQNQMASFFGSGSGTGEGSTNTAGSGSSENPGNNPVGSGVNNGTSWSLSGRSLVGNLTQPSYSSNAEGKVVVAIRVDEKGNVVSTSVGSGTNTSDQALIQAAFDAAKKAKFTGGSGPVVGTITYVFKLR